MGVGSHCQALAALPPGMTQYPLYRGLGKPQGQSRQVWKISPTMGFNPQTVQPIERSYNIPLLIKPYSSDYELPFVVSMPTVTLPSLFSEMNE